MGENGSHGTGGAVDQPGQRLAPSSQIRTRERMEFGKYELLHRLRVGGMAEVWKAREVSPPGRTLALKRILPSFTDEADYVAMFVDEARLSLRFSHPGIVRAFELGQIEDVHYIALELVEGPDVGALIRDAALREEPLGPALVCRIAMAVCDALHHAHELSDEHGKPLGIVHRDVSPQNLLVSYDGDVKLIDFGIAKSREQLMRTQAGLLKGKHGYLSPEQAQGQSVDRRSDLFSLGICMYELLAARRLFQGGSDFSTLGRVRNAQIPALESINRDVPSELAAIVHRALARERGARFQTAAELRRALHAFVQHDGADCERETLAHFVRERFRDAATAADGAPAREENTGLLAAFDALEPVTAVSALNDMPPGAVPPADEVAEPLSAGVGAAEAEPLREPPAAKPARASGSPASEAQTRVVSYESTQEGALAPASEPTRVDRCTPPQVRLPVAAEAPAAEAPARSALAGIGLLWSDEELSTQIYDPPSDDPTPPPAGRIPRATPTPRPATHASGAFSAPRVSSPPTSETLRTSRPTPAAVRTSRPTPAPLPRAAQATPLPGARARRPTPAGLGPSLPPARVSVPPPAAVPSFDGDAHAPVRGGLFAVHSELRVSMPPMGSNRSSTAPIRVVPVAHRGPSRGALAWAAAAAAIVVALVVAGVSWFGQPEPATLHVTTQPLDATVTVDGTLVPGTASPYVATDLAPDVEHEVEVSRPGYRSWRTRLRLRSGGVVTLPAVELQRETATSASPLPAIAAPIAVPPARSQRATPARHASTPKVTQATGANERRSATRSRTRTAARATPEPKPVVAAPTPAPVAAPAVAADAPGTLRLNSRPWSRVYIDGRLVGNTPQTSLQLSPGWHTVTLVNPEFGLQKVITLRIKPGEIATKIIELGG